MIHDSLPAKVHEFEQADLIIEDGFLFLEGRITIGDSSYTNRFLLHSGYGGAILFDDAFALRHALSDRLEITDEQVLKDSYGNNVYVRKANLPGFRIGDLRFADLPAGFFEGTVGRQQMSVLGGDVLRRVNWIFDFANKEVYMERSRQG